MSETGRPELRSRLQLHYRYVQRLRDRHGHLRHYLRKPGLERVALPGDYGSPEFAEAYRLALGGSTAMPREIGADRTVTGTLGHLIVAYKTSQAWTKLAKSSQSPRRVPLEKLRSGEWGRILVSNLKQKHIRAILAEVEAAHTKRHWLKMLRNLFAYAIEHNWIEEDPTLGAKAKVAKSDGYHTWTDEEIAQYRAHWPLGTQERLVLEFALETASRRCEVVRLGRQHLQVVKGIRRIAIERAKGSNGINIPVTPELAAAIDAMPANGALTYLIAPRGAPFSAANLGARIAQWVSAAGLPDHCRLHGLRKARCTQIANAGGTAHEIMGVSGHRSLAEAQRYTVAADRRRLADAAMARLQAGAG